MGCCVAIVVVDDDDQEIKNKILWHLPLFGKWCTPEYRLFRFFYSGVRSICLFAVICRSMGLLCLLLLLLLIMHHLSLSIYLSDIIWYPSVCLLSWISTILQPKTSSSSAAALKMDIELIVVYYVHLHFVAIRHSFEEISRCISISSSTHSSLLHTLSYRPDIEHEDRRSANKIAVLQQ